MIAYLIFIIAIVLLLSVDYACKQDKYGLGTLLAVFVAITFTVLRFETGYDYLNYVGFINGPVSELVDSNLEWGFVAVASVLKVFDIDYFWLFFLFGLAIILLLFRGIKLYTENVRIAFLIFLLIPGLFLNSFSIIRQSLAMVLLFNGYYYFFNQRYRYFWLFIILAVLFHYSALLALPFFWMATKLEKQARLILLIGIPISLVLAQMNVIEIVFGLILGSSKFGAYLDYEDSGTSLVKLIVLNVSVIPYLFFYKRFDTLNRSILILVIFGLMLINVFSSVAAITRIGYYFKIFEIVLLANVVSFFKRGWSQVIFCILLFIYYFTMFYTSLSFDYNEVIDYPKLTPYKTIFER